MLKLWTIQPIEWYEKLIEEGIIYGNIDLANIEADWLPAYKWMNQQMELKISKKPIKNAYPIWAWYHYENAKNKKPDLRHCGFLEQGTKGVRIEFKKPTNQVLLSDFNLWHLPLMFTNIADNELQDKEFDKLLENEGIDYLDKDNYTPKIKKIIFDSWQKIFDMNYCPEYFANPFKQKSIQATFWSLSVEEILKVDFFKAR